VNADPIIAAVQAELQRHSFDTFVDNPPAIARGGKGVVVSGCPTCKKRFQSLNQFVIHLNEDVIPATIRRAVSEQN
jgi:hypothetical protein